MELAQLSLIRVFRSRGRIRSGQVSIRSSLGISSTDSQFSLTDPRITLRHWYNVAPVSCSVIRPLIRSIVSDWIVHSAVVQFGFRRYHPRLSLGHFRRGSVFAYVI